jgi:hypothetical protein
MRPNHITIPCPKCAGTGKISLANRLTETLAIIRSKPNHAWSSEDVQALIPAGKKFSLPAICHRLKNLVDMGHITRRREGSRFFYYANAPKDNGK